MTAALRNHFSLFAKLVLVSCILFFGFISESGAGLVQDSKSRQVVLLIAGGPAGQKEIAPLAEFLSVAGVRTITLAPDTGPKGLFRLKKSIGKAVRDLLRSVDVKEILCVAHGAGGLALLDYLNSPSRPKDLKKALFLALPFHGIDLPAPKNACVKAWQKRIGFFYGPDILKESKPGSLWVERVKQKGFPQGMLIGIAQGKLDQKALRTMLKRAGCDKELASLPGDGVLPKVHPEDFPGWGRDDRFYQVVGSHLGIAARRMTHDLVRRFSKTKPKKGGSVACVLVMDGSGSVRATDKENMRGQAIKLLISRFVPGDQVGIVSFNLKAKTILPLTDIISRSMAGKLSNKIKKLPARGDTNIASGLQRALELLDKAKPYRDKVVVLMTDGKNDPETFNTPTLELAQKMASQGIVCYAVGLTDKVDQAFLSTLAKKTGGIYLHAANAQDLTAAFDRVQARIDGASLLLTKKQKTPAQFELLIDSSVRRLDMSLFGQDKGLDLKIISPENKEIQPPKAKGKGFLTCSVKRPMVGVWKIKIIAPIQKEFKFQAKAATDLTAKLALSVKQPRQNKPWPFAIDITQDDLPVAQAKALVVITESNGKKTKMTLIPATGGGFSASQSSYGVLSARYKGFSKEGSAHFYAKVTGLNREKEPFQRLVSVALQVDKEDQKGSFQGSFKGRVQRKED